MSSFFIFIRSVSRVERLNWSLWCTSVCVLGWFEWTVTKNFQFSKFHQISKIPEPKDSPPAWTQEAYRPPRNNCMLCCSVPGGGGTPSSPPLPHWKGPGTSDLGKNLGLGYPPPHRVWTDIHLWKQYLPHPSDAGGKSLFQTNVWFLNSPTPTQTLAWFIFIPSSSHISLFISILFQLDISL